MRSVLTLRRICRPLRFAHSRHGLRSRRRTDCCPAGTSVQECITGIVEDSDQSYGHSRGRADSSAPRMCLRRGVARRASIVPARRSGPIRGCTCPTSPTGDAGGSHRQQGISHPPRPFRRRRSALRSERRWKSTRREGYDECCTHLPPSAGRNFRSVPSCLRLAGCRVSSHSNDGDRG